MGQRRFGLPELVSACVPGAGVMPAPLVPGVDADGVTGGAVEAVEVVGIGVVVVDAEVVDVVVFDAAPVPWQHITATTMAARAANQKPPPNTAGVAWNGAATRWLRSAIARWAPVRRAIVRRVTSLHVCVVFRRGTPPCLRAR